MRVFLTCIWLCLLLSCKSQSAKKIEVGDAKTIQKIVGKEATKLINPSGHYLLLIQKKDEKFPTRLLIAVVVNSKTNTIVWRDKFVPGYIKWIDENKLEILDLPGMIKSDQSLADYKRIVEIHPQEKL